MHFKNIHKIARRKGKISSEIVPLFHENADGDQCSSCSSPSSQPQQHTAQLCQKSVFLMLCIF